MGVNPETENRVEIYKFVEGTDWVIGTVTEVFAFFLAGLISMF